MATAAPPIPDATRHSTSKAPVYTPTQPPPQRSYSPAEVELLGKLKVLTLFVTTMCNAKCETCFFWENLNDDEHVLSLDEMKRLSESMPQFPHLLCSGGEPFMRKNFAEILCAFAANNRLVSVTIPTNGLLTRKTIEVMRKVKWEFPELLIELSFSLDGLAETHNRLRGVPDNFRKTLETMNACGELRKEFDVAFPGLEDRFIILTNTCITNQNHQDAKPLVDVLRSSVPLDGMNFEILRGDPMNKDLTPPPRDAISEIHALSLKVNREFYWARDIRNAPTKWSYLKRLYESQERHIDAGHNGLVCAAGEGLVVIEPNADVRHCELLDKVANLRDYGMDFKAMWLDVEARRQRKWIVDSKCSCTHCVNLGHSIDTTGRSRFRRHAFERLLRSGLASWIN